MKSTKKTGKDANYFVVCMTDDTLVRGPYSSIADAEKDCAAVYRMDEEGDIFYIAKAIKRYRFPEIKIVWETL